MKSLPIPSFSLPLLPVLSIPIDKYITKKIVDIHDFYYQVTPLSFSFFLLVHHQAVNV